MTQTYSVANAVDRATRAGTAAAHQYEQTLFALSRRSERAARDYGQRMQAFWTDAGEVWRGLLSSQASRALADDFQAYTTDAARRSALTLDILSERADQDAAHEQHGTPPVLIYEHEVVVDGKTLPRPTNKVLLKIIPPAGIEVRDWKRPYIIIDPRAGHGAGIGGFKTDSQVGVALRDGHPVYFVVFRPHPEPGQTLADVMRSEAAFVAEVHRRHPNAPNPVIVGNCQGGWATLILAASNPEITGPLVINGAPVAYWSGRLGENPMRYSGGLAGGVVPAQFLSDLGYGQFDGAHLVSNFEQLNPSRNYFGKYYDLFAAPEQGREKFLEFEKWWGGFHFMNEQEMVWIIQNLFVGNKLARREAELEPGRPIDLKAIRSPIVVFASRGDNITPPQQALNWIVDTYADEQEIKIRGQRIVYMVHDKVGHLGIFVSSAIAKREHSEVTSTLKTIEALSPGLYEMVIDEQRGEGADAAFQVSFHERKMADILAIDENDRTDERAFAAVQRLSQLGGELYSIGLRPFVQACVTETSAEWMRALHPSRLSRSAFSSKNPTTALMRAAVGQASASRAELRADNPFLAAEKLWAKATETAMDACRDWREALQETTFLSVYASPAMVEFGEPFAFSRTLKDPKALRFLPEVQATLLGVNRGGFPEAVIRMLILMAESRATIRRDRLERSATVLAKDEPFASLGPATRAQLIHEQSVIVEFEPERAIDSLPRLLKDGEERRKAIEVVEYIAGSVEEMEPGTLRTLQRFRATLGLTALVLSAPAADPLRIETPGHTEAQAAE